MTLTKSSVLRIATEAELNTPRHGDGLYVIRFWLPIVGPTTTMLRHVLLDELATHGTLSYDGARLVRVLIMDDLLARCGITHPNVMENALLWGARRHYWSVDDEGWWLIPGQVPLVPGRLVRKEGAAFAARHEDYLKVMARA